MPKPLPKKHLICTEKPNFAGTFKEHMTQGHSKGARHSGLHSLNELMRDSGSYSLSGKETDARKNTIYAADVKLKGNERSKRSSFFPNDMNYDEIKAKVTEAWQDSKTYYKADTIYAQLAAKYGLAWVGLADIDGQKIWVGSTKSGNSSNPIVTAFPAVNNKFIKPDPSDE
jgi:hypothetical protein